ncbi:MAG: glycoside hydrolase family 2 protein [Terriglobia bacterium]
MRRRDFLLELPASVLIAATSGLAQRFTRTAPSPAVVNPVFRSKARPWLSLNGEWDFSLDPNDEGFTAEWFSPTHWPEQNSLTRTINVPGAWEAEGIGKPGISHSTAREFARVPLRHEYVGISWYRKTRNIPAGWEGKRTWLKIGGVDSKGWFWVNGKYLGSLHNYTSGGFKFEVTPFLKEGENSVVVRVDNKLNSRKGGAVWRDQFGGLYRGVELEATSQAYLDDVWVRPDFDNRRALLKVMLGPPWHKQGAVNYRIVVQVYTLPEGNQAGEAEVTMNSFPDFPMRRRMGGTPHGVYARAAELTVPIDLNPFRSWSPEHPFLYRAEVQLEQGGKEIDGWVERFGVRKIERRGPDFFLNGRRYFFRGFGDDYIYPLTVSSPPSREYHKQHLELAHSYGFNYIRQHTHVDTPEYFEAADEVGIMIQAGLPYEGIRPSPPGPYQPLDDLNELCHHYRRYVSLTTYSMGNEGYHKEGYRRTLYRFAKLLDPTRLVLHQDGGTNYEGISDFRSGPTNVPIHEQDVKGTMPVVLHEYLNLSGPPDPRLEPLFTGAVVSPFHLEAVKEQLQKLGLDWSLVERAIQGGHKLQSIYQKLGLEDARSVPGVDGYDYWTVVDVLALMPQGLFDLFWRPKHSSAAYFRQFNSATALLLPDLSPYGVDRVFTSGDAVSHTLSCANFGENAITDSTVSWSLEGTGKTYSQGQLENVNVSQGTLTQMGRLQFHMPVLDSPLELSLRVQIENRNVRNDWKFYCFPASRARRELRRASATEAIYHQLQAFYPGLKQVHKDFAHQHHHPEEVLITDRIDRNAFSLFNAGGKVLLLGLADFSAQKVGARLGWWYPTGNQRGTALADSEAFGSFPTDGGLPNPALFRLFHEAVELNERLANRFEPLALTLGSGPFVIPVEKTPPWSGQVDVSASRGTSYLMNVFETRVGSGRLLASGFDVMSGKPEADYMLDTFLKYVGSPQFEPKKTIAVNDLRGIISAAE